MPPRYPRTEYTSARIGCAIQAAPGKSLAGGHLASTLVTEQVLQLKG